MISKRGLILTKAQFKVAALIAMGEGAKGAANTLFNSVRTIETHLTRIKQTNKLRNSNELTKEFVLQYGDPSRYIEKIKKNEKIILSTTYFFLATQFMVMIVNSDLDMRVPRRVRTTKTVRRK